MRGRRAGERGFGYEKNRRYRAARRREGITNRPSRHTKKNVHAICGILLLAAVGARAATLPPDPDNAALLYYQAYLLLPEPSVAEIRARGDVLLGGEPNETLRFYLKRADDAFEFMITAADRTSCRWGVPYSKVFGLPLAQGILIRDLSLWMKANARVLAADGHPGTALERRVTLRRFASHVGDGPPLMYLNSLGVDMSAL